jgi:hypothetical protein
MAGLAGTPSNPATWLGNGWDGISRRSDPVRAGVTMESAGRQGKGGEPIYLSGIHITGISRIGGWMCEPFLPLPIPYTREEIWLAFRLGYGADGRSVGDAAGWTGLELGETS